MLPELSELDSGFLAEGLDATGLAAVGFTATGLAAGKTLPLDVPLKAW